MNGQALDIQTLPLHSRRLIEASAGTGKTYALTLLVLRALIERQLPLENILIVTFTEAATQELTERIRSRLVNAIAFYRDGTAIDPNAQSILENTDSPEKALVLLLDALQNLDNASIFTIHGFCQRTLQDSAFASGVPLSVEIDQKDSVRLKQIISDFWRQKNYLASTHDCAWWQQEGLTPTKLFEISKQFLNAQALIIEPENDDIESIKESLEQYFQSLKSKSIAFENGIKSLLSDPKYPLNARSYKQDKLATWVSEAINWLTHENIIPPPASLEKLGYEKLQKGLKKGQELPEIQGIHLIDDILHLIQKRGPANLKHWLSELHDKISTELTELKMQAGAQSFDDLLLNLHNALKNDHDKQLTNALRHQYPLALIDEFQDTDACQYAIFNHLYPIKDHHLGCLLIGDPKQAIYRFRGADIDTYLSAANTIPQSQRYTLNTNFRSNSRLIYLLNSIYENNPDPFKTQSKIEYQNITAAGHADKNTLRVNGENYPSLTYRELPDDLKSDAAKTWALRHMVNDISLLLRHAQNNLAQFGETPLCSGDIAILVRTNQQIEWVKQALNQAGIASVSLGNSSVYDSDEVTLLHYWLDALATPNNERKVKSLLLTPLAQLKINDIIDANNDPSLLGQWITLLLQCQSRCLYSGPLPALLLWLREAKITQSLLIKNQHKAARQLTNLLHLAEQLQTSGERSPELLKKLLTQSQNQGSDDALQRLESDQSLIKIISMHKSKGLQYPLVFLPFAWSHSQIKTPQMALLKKQDEPWILDLGSTELNQRQIELNAQSDAEDQRLLYVALTRAEQSLYVYTNPHKTTPWKELVPDNSTMESNLSNDCQKLTENDAVENLENKVTKPKTSNLSAKSVQRPVYQGWQIHSYTSLSHGAQENIEIPDYDRETATNIYQPTVDIDLEQAEKIASFPRGANIGVFLHAMLEHIEFTDESQDIDILTPLMKQYAIDEEWLPTLCAWLSHIRQAHLHEKFSLSELKRTDRRDELSFYLPFKPGRAQALSKTLRTHKIPCSTLNDRHLKGFLKGFIDLSYRVDNQYFLADYKSNHLGDHLAHYANDKLQMAMIEHNYYLQAALYCIAMHRLLRLRLPNYSYETDFGGISYLFLRGMRKQKTDGILFFKPSIGLINQLDDFFQ